MKAIFKREVRSYFSSLLATCVFLCSWPCTAFITTLPC